MTVPVRVILQSLVTIIFSTIAGCALLFGIFLAATLGWNQLN